MQILKCAFFILMGLLFITCKKKHSDPTPAAVVPPTVYYAKYTLRDSSYNFSSAKYVTPSFGTDQVACRISLPTDFYNDIEITFQEKSSDVQLTYSRLKALEKTYVPIQYDVDENNGPQPDSGIYVSITYANPNESYFTDNVSKQDQKGSFYIQSVTPLASTAFSPNTKRCEIKGTFNCTMFCSDYNNYELTNGTYYLLYEFWPE